jgi:hypothetical protein
MCVNPTKTAATLMAAILPTLKSLLTVLGLINTPQGIAAIDAYNAALTALQNWQGGTAAQNVLELLAAFQAVFNAIPLPAIDVVFGNIILAGIETVIGIVTGNSPAPAALAGTAAHEETQAMYAADVAVETAAKVQALVPEFKRSIWHSPEHQYATAWNKAVQANPNSGLVTI